MASVFDVAKYILEKTGSLSTMKLQKLVYYAQAWSLVWDEYPDAPLFKERIEAWVNGPVVPALFATHKGIYSVDASYPAFAQCGDNLSDNQKDTINKVIEFYGCHSSQWLKDLTHAEEPWIQSRKGLPEGERGNSEITLESMAEYYGSL